MCQHALSLKSWTELTHYNLSLFCFKSQQILCKVKLQISEEKTGNGCSCRRQFWLPEDVCLLKPSLYWDSHSWENKSTNMQQQFKIKKKKKKIGQLTPPLYFVPMKYYPCSWALLNSVTHWESWMCYVRREQLGMEKVFVWTWKRPTHCDSGQDGWITSLHKPFLELPS